MTYDTNAILTDILTRTHLDQFNQALRGNNLQTLYERHENYLLRTYFAGNRLHLSVTMRSLFNQFQPVGDEVMVTQKSRELTRLSRLIKLAKRERRDASEYVAQYNALVAEVNTLNAPVKKLITLYRKLHARPAHP